MDGDNREDSQIARQRAVNWGSVWASPATVPGLVLGAAIMLCFWPLMRVLPETWLSEDGYYSHGFLVPLLAAYVVVRRWPQLREIAPTSGTWAVVPLLGLLYVAWAGGVAELRFVQSFCLVGVLICATWFVAGWRWATGLSLPSLYLLFALPVWTFAVNQYTAPLQWLSTRVSYMMLQLGGLSPAMPGNNANTILLDHYSFEVAVACSGFKLLVAVTAFTALFMMLASLRWWGNVAMAAIVLPLCLFINGLRVALIGVVGEYNGSEAALVFHDWSGYITLLICFYILFRFARLLGWKD